MLKLIRSMAGERYCLGISMSGVSLLHSSAGWKHKTTLLADQLFTDVSNSIFDSLRKTCSDLLLENNIFGSAVSIVLDDTWSRFFFVTPPANASSKQDLVAAAKIRFETLYGDTSDDWLIDADYETEEAFMACGISRKILSIMQEICDTHQLKVISISTRFLATWNRHYRKLPIGSWIGLINDQVLTLGMIDQQRLVGIRNISISEHDQNWLQACLNREALRFRISPPKQLMLAGNVGSYWITPDLHANKPNQETLICKNLEHASPDEQSTWSAQARLALLGLQS